MITIPPKRFIDAYSSHLPRTPCDQFVYLFSFSFFLFFFFFFFFGGGGGHRRWLRATAYVFTLSAGIVRILLRGLGGNPGATRGKSVQRLCADCTEIVQCQCSCRAVSAASARKSYGDHAGIGLRTVPVRRLCNAIYDMSTGYGLTIFFLLQICKSLSLNQIVEAAEPVNPYENLTATSCLRREASRRPHGKGDTGSVDPSQAKCELGMKYDIDIALNSFVLMPSSHLPRTPCDKFVYDFPCHFGGIVGDYGQRYMCSHCLRASCNFFYGVSGVTRGKSV